MISHVDKIAQLKSVEMFENASADILDKLATIAEDVTFEKEAAVITQGKKCPNLYISLEGEMGIYLQVDGRSQEIARLNEPGKVVGEIGAVSGLSATASVIAISEEVTLLKLSGQQFHKIVSVEPELAATVLRSLARYLQS